LFVEAQKCGASNKTVANPGKTDGTSAHLECNPCLHNEFEADSVLSETLAERLAERQNGGCLRRAEADVIGKILASAGYPPDVLLIDFETYFDSRYSLEKRDYPIPLYVSDPRFRVHGVAVRWPDGRVEFRTDARQLISELTAAYGAALEAVTIVCHNCAFDVYVLAKRLDLHPSFMVDTLALARHVHPGIGNSLRELAIRYHLEPKGDLDGLKGVREPDPRQLAQLSAYARHDVALTHELLLRLLPGLSRPEVELRIAAHTIRLFTERGIAFDMAAAEELKAELRAQVDRVMAAAGADRATARSRALVDMLAAELARTGRALPVKPGKKGDIPALTKTDTAMQKLVRDADPRVAALSQAWLAAKSEPALVNRLDKLLAIAKAGGGNVPVQLQYCGAHTGRFSGAGGVNFQNMAARVEGPAKQLRGLFIPRPGCRLVIADAAQIECRVLAWLAGQTDLLQSLARDEDPYSELASAVLGLVVRKPTDAVPPPVRDELVRQRQLGKMAVLGLGYQMGAATFWRQLQSNAMVAELVRAGRVTEALADQAVRYFRNRFQQIYWLWWYANNAFERALALEAMRLSTCVVWRDGPDILVQLPSGRRLTCPQVDYGLDGKLTYAGTHKLYGGLIVENIVQAIARDILVDAVLELGRLGLAVVLHVHDEVVLEVPAETADTARATAIQVLSRTPAWAPGLPLAAEGHVADRYGK
jgi:DNA polymerase